MEWILIMIVFGGITAVVSKNKGESSILGFLMGLCLGPLGLILAFVTGGAVCGRCKKSIHPKATKCPYCQSMLSEETDVKTDKESKYKTSLMVGGIVVGVITLVILVYTVIKTVLS